MYGANSHLYDSIIESISESTWAYFAGLVDGDGTILIQRNSSRSNRQYRDGWRRTYVLSVSSVSLNFLNQLHDLIKLGKVRAYFYKKTYSKSHYGNVNFYRFETNEIRAILPKIIPYLVLKKNLAEIMWRSLKIIEEVRPVEIRREKLKMLDVEFRTTFLASRGHLPHKNSSSYWNRKRAEKGLPPVATLFD